ncbi:endonuclease [Streptococcus intermedius]|uniref:McrB family protein n=1 Tax=Streptococcus intermedius TaxID=1338 RepID=UPI000C84B0FE|nr:AAA family ATPase [Streptococcus intermedius]PMR92692.1 endonuclease [Streptococcus intermedius]
MENREVKIWKMSHSGDVTKYREKFLERQVIVLHKDTRKNQGKFFREELKKGDLFYLCFGSSAIKLIGRVTSDNAIENPEMGGGWIERSYEIVKKSTSNNKFKGSPKWWLPSGNTTIRKIKDSELLEFEEIILKPFFEMTLDQMKGAKKIGMTSYINRLIESKNLILRGAPGTGKTYLAKQIAEELTDGNEDQIGFVQFHPSYDYTDFVEGLRPSSGDDGQIGFKLQDGIFREFCKKATESGGRNNFDEAWKLFYDEALNVPYKVKYQFESNHKKYYLIALSEDEVDLSEGEGRQSGVVYDENKKDLGFYSKDIVQEVYNEGLIANDRVSEIIIQHLKEKYGLVDYVKPTETTTDKNFVFIIDEINRGEISKIFGELFFSIDPDYRGKDGKVTTQYANLRETDKEFYIPENVYIIGTMNDIDRSVDTFDFAMRRRFRFVEIKAADTMGMWENNDKFDNDKIEEARIRLTNLNRAISNTEGLNSHYHIGPSYFLKLPSVNYDYDLLWSDYLEPLLKDYLRGSYDETDSLDKLKDAYNNEEETDETH